MKFDRAKEIVSSPVLSHVTYNNAPIYIDMVNDNDYTANIHFLEDPQRKSQVPVDQLMEN